MIERLFVGIDVQNAALFQIEGNIGFACHRKQVFARGDRHAGRGDRVALIIGDVGQKLGHPAVFVP